MKQKLLFILATIMFLLFRICVNAQTSPNPGGGLYAELAKMDSVVFANVYTCNTAKNETFFTDDIEFYHDKGGVTKTKRALVDQLKENFCGEGKTKLRRELIAGSMQVYPINNYGAVQMGDHRFYVTENARVPDGQGKEVLSGVAKFIHVWKYENGEWRISRVFSYDHGAPGVKNPATSGELYQIISSNDSALSRTFNAHNIEQLKTFFSKDLEFYTDESGVTNYDQTFKKMFAGNNNGVTRELIPNSLEVYPIKDYGAIEVGKHRFCPVDKQDNNCNTVSFIILWQNQGGNWKVSRVISYNH